MAKHKPEQQVKSGLKAATIGNLITEVRATSGLKPPTLNGYVQSLRLIAAHISGVGDQPVQDTHGNVIKDKKGKPVLRSRFDYRAGGRDAWCAAVDALPLAIFTSDAIQRWRLAYIERKGSAPDARRSAETSANSTIRNARSLFSDKALAFARGSLQLPSPLPFSGIKLTKKGNRKYQSKIDLQRLLSQAISELSGPPLQIFILGSMCGLRKREIDLLEWTQVDFSGAKLRIERTSHFEPKSEDSIGSVDLEPELVALMRRWKNEQEGNFVIPCHLPPRHHQSRVNYRCEPHFVRLYEWLRSKGVSARKPLHELRKELGAVIASKDGIFAAQQMLRHAQITTTSEYYADKKRPVTAGLGGFLAGGTPSRD